MGIKINGSTSGSVELDVPAVVSGGDIALTLPDTAGDFMVKDASGNTDVTSINSLNFPTAGPLFARNKIINGSMEVAQRGTSSTANGYVSLDRWYVNQSGGSTTFSQETFAAGSEIDSFEKYAKLAVTSSSDYTGIRQRIEDVRKLPAGTITVSFWAKGTNPTGGLAVYLVQSFGVGGSAEVDIAEQTVSLTSSWQRFDLQFTIPSFSGKTIGAGSFLQVSIGQGANTGTSAYELNITGVQLEVGAKATPYEHRSYGDELARCQRYYQTGACWIIGFGSTYGYIGSAQNFTTYMRVNNPNVVLNTPAENVNFSSIYLAVYGNGFRLLGVIATGTNINAYYTNTFAASAEL